MCEYCNVKIYVAKRKIMRDLIAPASLEGVIKQRLEDITGIQYMEINNVYCPICGTKVYKKNN